MISKQVIGAGIFLVFAAFAACNSTTKSNPVIREATDNAIKIDAQGLFISKCSSCHGADGKLGMGGAKVLPDSRLTHSQIVVQIKEGKKAMPAFASQLSEAEINALADFVISLRTAK